MQFHTVIGGTGAVGRFVLRELRKMSLPVRVIHRSKPFLPVETIQVDVLDQLSLRRALKDSSHVYFCASLPYRYLEWKKKWPIMVLNVVEACAAAGAKLIFLDNTYMYGPPPLAVPFDENHSQKPSSHKGKIRKQAAAKIISETQSGRIHALIGRATDIYGPSAVNSILYRRFLEKMLAGKKPTTFINPQAKRTYAYTEDVAKALVMLALEPSCYGQVWHLPAGEPVTLDEITSICNQLLEKKFKVNYISPSLRKFLAAFSNPVKEIDEISYMLDEDHVINWEKFRHQFPHFRVTPYQEGISRMIKSFSIL